MLVESTTIAVGLAIVAITVRIVHLLLDAPCMGYGVARHINSNQSVMMSKMSKVGLLQWRHVEHSSKGDIHI